MALPELTTEEIARYSRHLILDQVGLEGQRRLKGASVLCVGAGGLGSPALMYLAAAGVGRIGIVDFDRVDASNLQRQILHGTSSVGMPKVASAAARMKDINPHVKVESFAEPLTSANALSVLSTFDVVVDGTDNFPTRYLVNDAAVLLGKPYVYGSIFRFEGQASVFNYRGGPNYRDLYPEPPPPGLVPSCAEGGVLGVLPGIIGTIQATETVKVLLGLGDTLSGRLLLYDALRMRFRELALRRDPAARPIESLIDYDAFCGVSAHAPSTDQTQAAFPSMTAREVSAKLADGWEAFILDVRGPAEAAIVSLPGTHLRHTHHEVREIVDELPRDRAVLVYCKAGGRSARACSVLAEHGVEVVNLTGGILGWAAEVDPDMPTY
jgi:molybdopterin/thiamine biosynthesis adenylyltransferase/rhodanese-related sulfurtransferase